MLCFTVALLATQLVVACDRPSSDLSRPVLATGAAGPAPAKVAGERGVASDAVAAPQDALSQVRPPRDSVAPSMIIRNGSATVEVKKLDDAVQALRRLAQRFGGYVTNTSVTTGQDQTPAATIELKIPATRFDSAGRP
jgi:hypothetical protein